MNRGVALVALVGAALLAPADARAQEPVTWRIATLAPPGSGWMNIIDQWRQTNEGKTQGRLRIKVFPGGVQGDERDVVRKMRVGQLNGAGLTGVGLALINPNVRLLELPRLLRTDAELDHVRNKFASELERGFAERGYVLLGWADVGWVYMYANDPVRSQADLRRVKMVVGADDPVMQAMFTRLKMNGVPLGVPDILPALQTGLIDGCLGPPMAMLAFQWITKVRYVTTEPMFVAVGAMVVMKKDFDRLSEADRHLVLEESRGMERGLMQLIRSDNPRAMNAMQSKFGLNVIATPPDVIAELDRQGFAVWDEFAGLLYTDAFLERVKAALAEYRKSHT